MTDPVDDKTEQKTTARLQAPGRSRLGQASDPSQGPRKPSWLRRLLLVSLGLGLLLAVATVLLYRTGLARYHQPGPAPTALVVDIAKGAGLSQIVGQLTDAGILAATPVDRFIFLLVTRFNGQAGRLKAGEFAFPARVSMQGAVAIMVAGKVVQHKFTLPEGLTSLAAMALLHQAEALSGQVDGVPPEGSLLPETYLYIKGDSRPALVKRMQDAMKLATTESWAKRSEAAKALKSPHDLVVLASVIEKETGVAAERSLISGVFHNRMRLGMPLQSDPTVIYAVGGPAGLDRPLSRADLKRDHAYNSYTRIGLPPGPIANPGRAALMAAAQPMATKALYFVADGSGGHAFAETLAGHNRNVARWRQIEQKLKR